MIPGGKAVGHRVRAITIPDDDAEPRTLYLVPVDEEGRKCGAEVARAVSKSALVAKLHDLGKTFAGALPGKAYVPPAPPKAASEEEPA